ncbi:MAG: hypothetical protein ABFQ65_03140 [Nanoarchaeota archaeon]
MESASEQKNINGKPQGIAQPAKAIENPMSENGESEKMSFFKKWWFWAAIGAVVVIGLLVFFLF